MVTKLFTDEGSRQLSVFINVDDKCYIECKTEPDDDYYTGYVVLDKEDVLELIKELKNIAKQM